jgi:hypothetical protein
MANFLVAQARVLRVHTDERIVVHGTSQAIRVRGRR